MRSTTCSRVLIIPEIAGSELTLDHLRSAIRHHGTLLVRGLVDQERVAMLVDDIEHTLRAYDTRAGVQRPVRASSTGGTSRSGTVVSATSKSAHMRKRGSVLTVESPPAMFDLVETFDAVGLYFHNWCASTSANRQWYFARKATLRRISHDGESGGWHQDGAFMGVDIRSLNVWLALWRPVVTARRGLDIVGSATDRVGQ